MREGVIRKILRDECKRNVGEPVINLRSGSIFLSL